MLFFSKKKLKFEIKDTTDKIYLTKDGSSFYELSCDPVLYEKGLKSIHKILTNWIAEDRAIANSTAIDIKGTVSYLLNTLDLKMVPHAVYLEQLMNIINDDAVNRGGSRLLDTIALIYTVVPTEVIECFKGKFLYGMLYGLSNTNQNVLPTKEQWVYALTIIPWIPFIVIIQEILSTEYLGSTSSLLSDSLESGMNDEAQQSQ